MAEGLPTEVVVSFRAELDQLKAGLAEVRSQMAATGRSAADAGDQSERLIDVFGSGESRHLRLIAMELGSLDGAGAAASRSMFSLLGAARALSMGLNTLGGVFGLVVAGIGLAVTAIVSLIEWHKKAEEAARAHAEAELATRESLVKMDADSLALTERLKKLQDAGVKLPPMFAQWKGQLDQVFKAERKQQINDTIEAMTILDERYKAGKISVGEYTTQHNRLNIDFQMLKKTGMTLDEWLKKHEEELRKASKTHYDFGTASRDSAEAMKTYTEQLQKAEQELKHLSDSMASTLVSMARNHENFLDQLYKKLEETGERMAASAAIRIVLGFLTGGASGLVSAGMEGGSATGSDLLDTLFQLNRRTGGKSSPIGQGQGV